jgi:hypothetical protein
VWIAPVTAQVMMTFFDLVFAIAIAVPPLVII